LSGQSSTVRATIEQDVTLLDDQGMATRGLVINLSPQQVPVMKHQDVVITASGTRYQIDEIIDSPGYLMRAFISPE
jgi:hypothetical protein